jgi:hypothetical protein
MLLLLLLVMVSTGLAKTLLLALVRLATLSSLRMTTGALESRPPDAHMLAECPASAPEQNRASPEGSALAHVSLPTHACFLPMAWILALGPCVRSIEPHACIVGSKELATHCLF